MQLTTLIFFILLFTTTGKCQQTQPTYLGEASWHKVANQQERVPLPVSVINYPIKKITTQNKPVNIFQHPINPGTVTLHNGPTTPVIQKISITGKKLSKPRVVEAPALQIRDNVSFNISYTDKKHGFAENNAMDFAEDDEHNIWISSEKGLTKYDGYHYYSYDQGPNVPDMSDCSLAYDKQKRLWWASDNGVYFIKNDSLFSIQSPEIDFSAIACKRVMVDAWQRVWITTKTNGAICIEGTTIKIYDKRCGLPGNYFETVYLDKKGNLFMACRDYGIVLIEPDKMRMFFSNTKTMNYHTFLSFYEDEDGIWAGSFLSGMMRLGQKDTIQYSINGKFHEAIYDIKKAPGGIWFSCYSKAVCYFNKTNLLILDENNGLLNNFAIKLFEDSFQNVWVSNGSGFSRINENSFYLDKFRYPVPGSITNILPDPKKGGNWMVTFGGSLAFQKGNQTTTYTYTDPAGIQPFLYLTSGVQTGDGTLWTGTYGEGILRVNEQGFTCYRYSTLTDHEIVACVKEDAEKKVWICPTRYGLIVYDKNKFWRYTKKSGLVSDNVNVLFLDAGKKIYWAFAEGLQRFNGPDMETFYIGGKPFKGQVNQILDLDSETVLWATSKNGLLVIKKDQAYQLSTANGLTANVIRSIIRDTTGTIWISTEKGIESFKLNGLSITGHRIFNQSNGPYILDAGNVFLDSTGMPYWIVGGKKLVVNTDFIYSRKTTPVFSFKDISIDSQTVSPNELISILSNQKIKINYKTIYWGRENNLKLNYLLISNQKDTTERSIQNNGTIIISDVLPGNYQILLQANNNHDVYYSKPINITVRNFWYNTWSFRIILGVSIILGIIFYFRQKGKRQLMVNQLLKIKVSEQTEVIEKEKEALFQSNQIINLQNKEKDVLIEEINHRVKNNLQFIGAILELQLDNQISNDVIQALLGTSRRIKAMSLVHELLYNKKEEMGLSMRAYIQELIDNLSEIAIDDSNPVNIVMEVDDLLLSSKTALPLGMIISELVSNSFKHAFAGIEEPEVRIQLKEDPITEVFSLFVSDNGNGYKQNTEFSIGLGSSLVDIFSRQLDGTYTMQTDGHFTYELQFKITEP